MRVNAEPFKLPNFLNISNSTVLLCMGMECLVYPLTVEKNTNKVDARRKCNVRTQSAQLRSVQEGRAFCIHIIILTIIVPRGNTCMQ
jgi:hypothetical protein